MGEIISAMVEKHVSTSHLSFRRKVVSVHFQIICVCNKVNQSTGKRTNT